MRLIFFYIFLLLAFTSCEIINPAEEVPAYIHIDKFTLTDPAGSYGSISSNITDAWINIDGNLLGVYELPITFPVLAKGKHTILIRPGIKANGIAASRKIYPFYTTYTVDTILTESTILTLNPTITYRPETKPVNEWLNENFEENGIYFDTINKSEVALMKTSDPAIVFEGTHSGAILLPVGKNMFQCKTSSLFPIPYNNSSIYLEFNYRNNTEFIIGIYVNNSTQSILSQSFFHVNPSGEWNKVYLELTDMVYANMNFSSFNVFFGVSKSDTTKSCEIYLDNIKLMHF